MIPRVTLSAVTSEQLDVADVAHKRVGTTLHGKYTIERVLGVGGMGVVYAATHRNGKRFAIKLLHPEYSVRRDIRTRFLREGYVANAVNHPGVVAVLDDDVTDDGSAFLVMELLDGNTVEALGARPGARMELASALGIAYQLLDVLDCAHTRNIVHRDIKPANLFVLRDGQVKVLDFGLAKLRDVATGLNTTRTGETIGTPAFMPPEQARGEVSSIDPRTDIWAVGATLFTALSGCIVHEGENARQVMVRAATVPVRSLASVLPSAPDSVVQLVAKALEFDKTARWGSAQAMRAAVLRAHEELFGPPLREHVAILFETATSSVATAATKPSPWADSITTLDSSDVASASTSLAPVDPARPISHFAPAQTSAKQARRRLVRRAITLASVVVLSLSVAWWTLKRVGRTDTKNLPRIERLPFPPAPILESREPDTVLKLDVSQSGVDPTQVAAGAPTLAASAAHPIVRAQPKPMKSVAPAVQDAPKVSAPNLQLPPVAPSGPATQPNAPDSTRVAVSKKARRIDDAVDHQ